MINLGELLRTKREEKLLELSQVSESTKIPQKLLKALEEGDYEAFASDVYLKGFLKNYAKFLGIDVQKAMAVFRRERRAKEEDILQEAGKPLEEPRAIITPGRLVFVLTVLIVVSVIAFIAIQINNIMQPPYLELQNPVEGVAPSELFTEVNSDTITLTGKVEVGSKLLINGNEVTTNNLQEFRVDNYRLNSGSNEIYIVAQSYYFAKTSQIKLTVLSILEEEEASEEDLDAGSDESGETFLVDSMAADIEVGPEQAWVVVTVDGVTKISRVVEEGESFSFEAFETLTISSPRPQMVKLTINGEEYSFSAQAPAIFKLVNGNVVQE
jgi:hypothetical protein